MKPCRALLSLLALSVLLLVGAPSLAVTFAHSDVSTTNFDFTGIQETSSTDPNDPLFGQPIAGSQSIFFTPAGFTAISQGGGLDPTNSQLQLMVASQDPSNFFIETFIIDDFGDFTFLDPASIGTVATGVSASMSGFLTVTEVNGVVVAPTVIPLSVPTFNGFASTAGSLAFSTLPDEGAPIVKIWDGQIVVDVDSVVANATKATLSFDNNLSASSEASGSDETFAEITKKVTITVIPEPGTALLLGIGLLGLAVRSRRGRA